MKLKARAVESSPGIVQVGILLTLFDETCEHPD